MRHFVLTYELAPDYLERRPLFRAPHLALAWEAAERGELILAGALGDPVEGAMLLFQGESAAVAEAFACRSLCDERIGDQLAGTSLGDCCWRFGGEAGASGRLN